VEAKMNDTQCDVDTAKRQNQQETGGEHDNNAVDRSPDHPAT
jgi:hypothetical protein